MLVFRSIINAFKFFAKSINAESEDISIGHVMQVSVFENRPEFFYKSTNFGPNMFGYCRLDEIATMFDSIKTLLNGDNSSIKCQLGETTFYFTSRLSTISDETKKSSDSFQSLTCH